MVTIAMVALLAAGCGSDASTSPPPGDTSATSTTAIAPPDTSTTAAPSTTVTPTTATVPSDPAVSVGTFEVPVGTLDVTDGDMFVVHEDGDLWLHPGLRDGTPTDPVRLADMSDPRVPVVEGEGPNTVEQVAGAVDGVVYYGDCCEPIAGTTHGVTAPDTGQMVTFGYTPALSPQGTRLATVNTFGLWLGDLATGTSTYRSFEGVSPMMNPWDLVWTADGERLIVLSFDETGFALLPIDASPTLPPGSPVPIGMAFDPVHGPTLRFAGLGPGGEIAVASYGADRTEIRYFDAATLGEVSSAGRELPAGVTSVQLDADGVGLAWVDAGRLWYLPAGGEARSLGSGHAAAWFAP